jgi:hypothetical protein
MAAVPARIMARVAAYALAGAALFGVYLRLSCTGAENADMANILLMASDLRHGNLLLHGWYVSDVSFYTTELPQYALLESFLGVRMQTAHVAAAMTYTLALLLAVLLARGGTSGRQALTRTLVAAGIMLAPQLGGGVYALDMAVGHIGTSVPLLLIWLLLDRARPRWWVPALAAVMLAWALVADPLVLVAGVLPLATACMVRVIKGPAGDRARWYEMSLIGAAAAAAGLAWAAGWLLRAHGGYVEHAVSLSVRSPRDLRGALAALWQILDLFGADFRQLSGLELFFAILHLVSVGLVAWALLRVAARFFGHVTLTDQVLALAIAGGTTAYLVTTVSQQGAHEIALIEPFAAALAARTLVGPASLAEAAARSGIVALAGTGRRVLTAGYLAGALVLAGQVAGLGYELSQPSASPQYAGLASWLAAHHLTDGLASYWDSSSVTVDSGGLVTVRALRQTTMQPYLWMSDKAWYDPGTHRATFLVLDDQPGYSPDWPMSRIVGCFGRPARVYHTGPYTVLVWRHNLLRSIPR